MPMSELIQKLIHLLEVGTGSRYLRVLLLGLALVALALLYDLRAYKNMGTPEGMDAAQLARNISEGKGYTTQFIRPLSLYLVQKKNGGGADPAQIKTNHPDLANAPVYPVLLAGVMKALPFQEKVELHKSFWSNDEKFWRYQPDFLIALFNQLLLLAVVVLTFFIARDLFDLAVARLAAGLTLGSELLWRFSASGLSTELLLVIFLGLAWCLVKIEAAGREPQPNARRLQALVIAAGALAGLGVLTRYSFGWVIIPVVVYLILFGGPRRTVNVLSALGAFALLLLPWIIRNLAVSGTPFGTATFAVVEGTFLFPRNLLERSISPDLTHLLWLTPYTNKLLDNLRALVVNDVPKLAGSWATILFLAGLLLGFRSVAIRRMRYFLLTCLGLFLVVQSLGRTGLTDESPEVNSENLLVLLSPLVLIYAASVFFTFLENIQFPLPQLRYAAIIAFVMVCCLPMILVLLPPKTSPVAYPPYYPPDIQKSAGWMKENELMMSDVPWAVAWYGHRQCLWLTLNAQEDFFAINDGLKPIQALYLTPETMDGKFLTDWVHAGERSWGSFILDAVIQNKIPTGFPLRNTMPGYLPDGIFLADWERWKLPAARNPAP